jgi:DNA topoisomerase-1
MASLLKGVEPETATLEEAIATLNLPREIGVKLTKGTDEEPGTEAPVLAANGRFGPYLKWEKETRSIPAGESPLTITLERAMELLAQPKTRGRSQRAAPKVLKELGKHPDTDAEIKILDGRYGPYCTDGKTNASLPKGESIEEVDLDRALDLIAARAASGPSKKKKKKAAKKTSKKKKKGGKKVSVKR